MNYSTLRQFCEGWMEMTNKNKPNNGLNQCFYHFFASFVIYNCIYNFCFALKRKQFASNQASKNIKSKQSKQSKRNKQNKSDHYRAVDFMTSFADESNVIQSVLERNQETIEKILRVLNSDLIHIFNKSVDGNLSEKDEELKQKLSSTDNKEKFEKVLELLYNVRCNMFHGEKRFIPEQEDLLEPLNHILDDLNKTMLEKIQVLYEKSDA